MNIEKLSLVQAAITNFAQIGYKRVSDDNDYAGTFTFSEAANPKVSFDKISANEYICCMLLQQWLVGWTDAGCKL